MGHIATRPTCHLLARAIAMVAMLWLAFGTPPMYAQTPECSITRADEFDHLLEQGKTKIFFVKYEDALSKLQRAEDALPCLVAPLGRVSLGRLYLYKGVALFFLEKRVEARAAFEQAIVIDRRVSWDEQFGDLPKELYLEAKEAVIEYPKGSLRVPTDMKPETLVYVDGNPYESGTMAEGLSAGYHFVQVTQDGKVVKGMLFNVQANRQTTIPVPPELMQQRTPFDKEKLRPVSYLAMGAGGVALIAGTAAGTVTWMTQKNLTTNYYANRDDDEKDKLLARQKTAAYVADACLGAAIVFGGAGAAMYLASMPDRDADIYARLTTSLRVGRTSIRARWYPWSSLSASGLAVSGTF